jgi:endonuclease YncB( thermonuclease family)
MRAWEFINEGKVPFSPDIIADVRKAYDLGYTMKEIGQLTDLTVPKVGYILDRYHKDRNKRIENIAQAATPEDKVEMARLWQDGENVRNIAKKFAVDTTTVERWLDEILGQGTVKKDVALKRSQPGTERIAGKVTPEMVQKMRELFKTGMIARDISASLGNVVVPRTVSLTLAKQPDYVELRAQWETNYRRKVRPKLSATTGIYRPGTIGNLRHKGPSSRHMSGVFSPKKI